MATLKDISAVCGLSVASVSRALNDHSDISEAKKIMVREIAGQMGYGNPRMDRGRNHSFLIGILVTGEAQSRFNDLIIMEIRQFLMEEGYDVVILSPSEGEKENENRPAYLSRARMMKLEGIILFSSLQDKEICLGRKQKKLRELIFGEIPVVAVNCTLPSCGCVKPAYEEGLRSLFEHVYSKGHRRIAFLSGKTAGNCILWDETVENFLREKQLTVPRKFICRMEKDSSREAYDVTAELVSRDKWLSPTCILFGDQFLMEGGVSAILRQGLRIPEDLSVAAMCYSLREERAGICATSWFLSPARIAKEAVELILLEIRSPGITTRQIRVVEGVMREGWTTAPPAAALRA